MLQRSVPDEAPRLRADTLNHALSGLDIDSIRPHHLALAMAVIELAAASEAPFPWTHDDPTVALLRAAAKLSMTAPNATSSAAHELVARLQATGAVPDSAAPHPTSESIRSAATR